MFNSDEPRDARGRWTGGGLLATKAAWRDKPQSLGGGRGLAQALLTHPQLSLPTSRRFRPGWNDPAVVGHLSGLIHHWSDAEPLDDDAFRDRYLAHDAGPRTVRALRAMTEKAVSARTVGDLAQAGDHLAVAIGDIGVAGWPHFLKAAFVSTAAARTRAPKSLSAHGKRPHSARLHPSNAQKALTYDQIKDIVSRNNRSGLSNELVIAIIYAESRFKPHIKSTNPKSTAIGLMQVTETTRKGLKNEHPEFERYDLFDPAQNVIIGTQNLAKKLELTGGNLDLALQRSGSGSEGYARQILAGEMAIKEHENDPMAALQEIFDRKKK